MHRPGAVEAAVSSDKAGSVPTRLADHTLLLQGRWYPEARDLRRTKYGCCSNSTITCFNGRFLNLQQHSIRRGTAPWATGSAEAMEAALTGISDMLIVCFCSLSSSCLVYGAFVAAVAAMVSVLAWACLGSSFLGFCLWALIQCKND